jgi:hypothetical protein
VNVFVVIFGSGGGTLKEGFQTPIQGRCLLRRQLDRQTDLPDWIVFCWRRHDDGAALLLLLLLLLVLLSTV